MSATIFSPIARSLTGVCALACTLGLMLTSSGCSSGAAWSRNLAGKQHYRNGNYAAAQRSFEQAMMDDPWNPDYAFNVAAAMQKGGDVSNAEQMYQHSLSLSPSHQPTYHALASLMHTQGRTEEARQLLTSWVGTQPSSSEAHVEMAWLQQQTGDIGAAEMSLQQALQHNPQHAGAMAQLAQVYEQTGRTANAASLYGRSLDYNRSQPQVASRLNALNSSPSLQLAQQMQSDPSFAPLPQFAGGQPAMMGSPYQANHFGAPQMLMTGSTMGGVSQPMPAGMTQPPMAMMPQAGAMPASQLTMTPVPHAGNVAASGLTPAMAPTMQQTTFASPARFATPTNTVDVTTPAAAPASEPIDVSEIPFASEQSLVAPVTSSLTAPQTINLTSYEVGTPIPFGGPQLPGSPRMLVAPPAGMPMSTGTPIPMATSPAVQLGTPAPIMQDREAAVPAITSAMPVVPAF